MELHRLRKALVIAGLAGIGGGFIWGQHATATLTIGGSEQQAGGAWPSGALSITVNGQMETVGYGQFSTPSSLAAGFAAMFSSDPSATLPRLCTQGLCAKADGPKNHLRRPRTAFCRHSVERDLIHPSQWIAPEWPTATTGPLTMPQEPILGAC